MLIDITIKNYLSFKNTVCFSLEAGTWDEKENNFYDSWKNKILKSAILYGHNGGWKTNLLRAIDLVSKLIVEWYRIGPNEPILGFPNCRYQDGDTLYGARMKNFSQPELSLLIKDVSFYKKYLQQHRKKVFITGRHYILVTGVHLWLNISQGSGKADHGSAWVR